MALHPVNFNLKPVTDKAVEVVYHTGKYRVLVREGTFAYQSRGMQIASETGLRCDGIGENVNSRLVFGQPSILS